MIVKEKHMKAILITDMPNRCYFYKLYNAFYGICQFTGDRVRTENIMASNKLENCPLKPLPKYYEPSKRTNDYEMGWNCCIDEILGEK